MFCRRFAIRPRLSLFGHTTRFARWLKSRFAPASAGPTRPFALSLSALVLLLAGCATPPQVAPLMESPAVAQQIAAEPVGDFYIGRRVFAPPFAIWGYVRSPRQSWKTAKLVVLNEKFQFAPDRARNQLGSDNGSEYRIYGNFSGDQIYDASAGRFCAEFVLKRAELISANPEPIWSGDFIPYRQMFQGWPRGSSQPTSANP